MTRGELIFCLRDVHRYWSAPRISHHEIQELARLNLIKRTVAGIPAIRLTEDGARVKNWGPLSGSVAFGAAQGCAESQETGQVFKDAPPVFVSNAEDKRSVAACAPTRVICAYEQETNP